MSTIVAPTKVSIPVALALVGLAAAFNMAAAGTGGVEFDAVYTTIQGWFQGTLGKIIAVTALGVGLSIGIIRQSIMAVVIGVAMALALYYGPTVIDGLITATLPV
jgi:conjugal transfer pilus assembly protein TraA